MRLASVGPRPYAPGPQLVLAPIPSVRILTRGKHIGQLVCGKAV